MSGYTQEQLTALKAAVARGVRTVSYDGQSVTYASTAEMLRIIAMIERELSVTRGPILRTMPTDRGFGR